MRKTDDIDFQRKFQRMCFGFRKAFNDFNGGIRVKSAFNEDEQNGPVFQRGAVELQSLVRNRVEGNFGKFNTTITVTIL